MKYLKSALVCFSTSALFLLTGCFEDGNISKAKKQAYPDHSGTSFEKVLSAYEHCKEKNWATLELKTGEKYVEFKCLSSNPKDLKEAMQPWLEGRNAHLHDAIEKSTEFYEKRVKEAELRAIEQKTFHSNWLAKREEAYRINPTKYEAEQLQKAIEDKARFETPSYLAGIESAFEGKVESEKRALDREINIIETELRENIEAAVDGDMEIMLQWFVSNNGELSGRATAVRIDFGNWIFEGDGRGTLIYEAFYENRPIIEGLGSLFEPLQGYKTDPADILHRASITAMRKASKNVN